MIYRRSHRWHVLAAVHNMVSNNHASGSSKSNLCFVPPVFTTRSSKMCLTWEMHILLRQAALVLSVYFSREHMYNYVWKPMLKTCGWVSFCSFRDDIQCCLRVSVAGLGCRTTCTSSLLVHVDNIHSDHTVVLQFAVASENIITLRTSFPFISVHICWDWHGQLNT